MNTGLHMITGTRYRIANWTIESQQHPDGWDQWHAWPDGARTFGPLGQDPGVRSFSSFDGAVAFVHAQLRINGVVS